MIQILIFAIKCSHTHTINTHTCARTCLGGHWLPFVSFSEGKHVNMNSQPDNDHQQQSDNGCNHQIPNQNHKSEHGDRPGMQALPMPVPDPPIQYTKVSCIQESRVKANLRNDLRCSLVQISLFLEISLAHNTKAWSTEFHKGSL